MRRRARLGCGLSPIVSAHGPRSTGDSSQRRIRPAPAYVQKNQPATSADLTAKLVLAASSAGTSAKSMHCGSIVAGAGAPRGMTPRAASTGFGEDVLHALALLRAQIDHHVL